MILQWNLRDKCAVKLNVEDLVKLHVSTGETGMLLDGFDGCPIIVDRKKRDENHTSKEKIEINGKDRKRE